MKTPAQIGADVRKVLGDNPAEFKACAYFDERLDCIRVISRDCSVLETRINERLTILEDMYRSPGQMRYVGFTIKGARHFCRENSLKFAVPIKLTELLDALLQRFPEVKVQIFVDGFARRFVEEQKIEPVTIPDLEAAVA